MNSKLQKALSTCLLMALVATYSMVALANSGKAVGELMVNGDSETSFVTVNGEPSKTGRTVFSSSTIATPEGVGAAINFGKAGKVEFGPNTTFTLNFDGNVIGGDLGAGSITVLSAAEAVSVRTLAGETVKLNAGETATAGSGKAAQTKKDDLHWGWWALIAGGAAVAIIWTAMSSNDTDIGGGASTVSPVR